MHERPPAHAGLRHLALNTRALEEMRHFYVDVLGFEVEWEPDADNLYLTSGRDNLALHRAPPEAPDKAPTRSTFQHLDHLGVIVHKAEDVDAWAAYLERSGVTLDARPRTHRDGARSFYFRDPDGNRVQVIYHPPISGRL